MPKHTPAERAKPLGVTRRRRFFRGLGKGVFAAGVVGAAGAGAFFGTRAGIRGFTRGIEQNVINPTVQLVGRGAAFVVKSTRADLSNPIVQAVGKTTAFIVKLF